MMRTKMFIAALIAVLFLGVCDSSAQRLNSGRPENVPLMVYEQKDSIWYQNVMKQWEDFVKAHPEDGAAWRNLFNATHYYCQFTPSMQEKATEMEDALAKRIVAQQPGTYNYYHYLLRSGQDIDKRETTLKAMELFPDDAMLNDYDLMLSDLGHFFDPALMQTFCKKFVAYGGYPEGANAYANNVFVSMEDNAIFIGNGDLTILPLWLQQYGYGQHTDKLVICLSFFLWIDDYPQYIYRALGLDNMPKRPEKMEYYEDYENYVIVLLEDICSRTGRPLYLSAHNGEVADFLTEHYSLDNCGYVYKAYDKGRGEHTINGEKIRSLLNKGWDLSFVNQNPPSFANSLYERNNFMLAGILRNYICNEEPGKQKIDDVISIYNKAWKKAKFVSKDTRDEIDAAMKEYLPGFQLSR